jgi:anthranilate synthase component 1
MFSPSREEFHRLAQQSNLIPVYREILADMETPVSAFRKIARGRYSFLLESVAGGERIARYSFLGTEPALVFRSKGREIRLLRDGEVTTETLAQGQDPLHRLRRLLIPYRIALPAELPRFVGGLVGYIAYDMVRFFERLPEHTVDDLQVDDSCFLLADSLLIFDHVRHRIIGLSNAHVQGDVDRAYDEACARVDEMIERLRAPLPPSPKTPPRQTPVVFTPNQSPEQYQQAVARTKEYIAAGDGTQMVISQRWQAPVQAHPFDVYRALRSLNPSPYMFYLELDDVVLAGASPEILVTVEKRIATTRPIAGTRPRGKTPEDDKRLAQELLADEKERAEHVMLVDLGRNDLGRVCAYGTVRVDELMTIEQYSHVIHIVSDVKGRLAPDKDAFDALRACFPAGTVSGAPKVRAMEIIEELEPTRRGVYAGAVGYFSFSGDMDTCIAIRTIVMKNGIAYIQAGAGIVADSVPEREHQECLNKARALMRAVEMAEAGLE